jgi:hypothetical protein
MPYAFAFTLVNQKFWWRAKDARAFLGKSGCSFSRLRMYATSAMVGSREVNGRAALIEKSISS